MPILAIVLEIREYRAIINQNYHIKKQTFFSDPSLTLEFRLLGLNISLSIFLLYIFLLSPLYIFLLLNSFRVSNQGSTFLHIFDDIKDANDGSRLNEAY